MIRPGKPITGEARRGSWIALGVLTLFTATAIAGYWVFALHPNLIPDSDFARGMYGVSFKLFARLHIVVSAAVLAWFLISTSRFRWVPAFAAVALVSFLSEYIGTGYGFPFSGYEYTSLLGYKLGGRVPAVIPVSWFLMALPSWAMARVLFPDKSHRLWRVLLAAYILTAWDLALDPAMSFLTPYWVWEGSGPYYGMPWVNLAGWMGTGIAIMLLLEILGASVWAASLDARWLTAYYGVVLLMPVGMLAAAGHWLGVVTTFAALLLGWSMAVAVKGFQGRRRVLPILKEPAT